MPRATRWSLVGVTAEVAADEAVGADTEALP